MCLYYTVSSYINAYSQLRGCVSYIDRRRVFDAYILGIRHYILKILGWNIFPSDFNRVYCFFLNMSFHMIFFCWKLGCIQFLVEK